MFFFENFSELKLPLQLFHKKRSVDIKTFYLHVRNVYINTFYLQIRSVHINTFYPHVRTR